MYLVAERMLFGFTATEVVAGATLILAVATAFLGISSWRTGSHAARTADAAQKDLLLRAGAFVLVHKVGGGSSQQGQRLYTAEVGNVAAAPAFDIRIAIQIEDSAGTQDSWEGRLPSLASDESTVLEEWLPVSAPWPVMRWSLTTDYRDIMGNDYRTVSVIRHDGGKYTTLLRKVSRRLAGEKRYEDVFAGGAQS